MKKVMEVNCLAHFWTLKAFLPNMIKKDHGHIVTISSAGGISGCCGLTDYSASKFAVFGLHESLRLELRNISKHIDTLVVCPFFMNTGMFDGVTTKYPRLLPILNPENVADKIVKSMKRRDYQLVIPSIVYITFLVRLILSVPLMDLVTDRLGLCNSMDTFIGRKSRRN